MAGSEGRPGAPADCAIGRGPRYGDRTFTPASLGSRSVKKGRHRRFEEARKLKQSGPEFLFGNDVIRTPDDTDTDTDVEDDEYAALARKYGALDDEPSDDD
jgi:hypothetical protein